jgi:hypothetical protein
MPCPGPLAKRYFKVFSKQYVVLYNPYSFPTSVGRTSGDEGIQSGADYGAVLLGRALGESLLKGFTFNDLRRFSSRLFTDCDWFCVLFYTMCIELYSFGIHPIVGREDRDGAYFVKAL